VERLRIFLDTSILHRISRIDVENPDDPLYEEDRVYLRKLSGMHLKSDDIEFYVNPSVKSEIDATRNQDRRRQLQELFEKYRFIPFNKTIFPFTFPVTFITRDEVGTLGRLCRDNPGLKKDQKIIADAAFSQNMDILLTTDRKHLADRGIRIMHLKIFTPKELFEYLSSPH